MIVSLQIKCSFLQIAVWKLLIHSSTWKYSIESFKSVLVYVIVHPWLWNEGVLTVSLARVSTTALFSQTRTD